MRVANGIEMLEIRANIMGRESVIHPTLLWNGEDAILVDAGYPGQMPLIREAMEKAGISFEKLKKIIFTHHDIDHIGSAGSILKELSQTVEMICHEEEKPYIQGDKMPMKIAQMEAKFEQLSEEMKGFYKAIKAAFANSFVKVDKTLKEGEELPYLGGVRVVFTPGHTAGHLCLYLKESKTLIAGDLLAIEQGMLVKSPPFINYNEELNSKSIEKLKQYDIQNVICYHGGLFNQDTNKHIAELTGIK